MAILPYDVNTYLQGHSAMVAIMNQYGFNTPIQIVPINSPEPCNSTGGPLGQPFLRYYWMPNIMSSIRWFIRSDKIRYYVMDRDIDRAFNIAETMVQILGNPSLAGNPHKIICNDNSNNIFFSTITAANTSSRAVSAENTKEGGGLVENMLEFEFRYTKQPL